MMDDDELRQKIHEACDGSRAKDVVVALGILLVEVIQAIHNCTREKAVDIIIEFMTEVKQNPDFSSEQPDVMLQQ